MGPMLPRSLPYNKDRLCPLKAVHSRQGAVHCNRRFAGAVYYQQDRTRAEIGENKA